MLAEPNRLKQYSARYEQVVELWLTAMFGAGSAPSATLPGHTEIEALNAKYSLDGYMLDLRKMI
jgi:hypothetical protein